LPVRSSKNVMLMDYRVDPVVLSQLYAQIAGPILLVEDAGLVLFSLFPSFLFRILHARLSSFSFLSSSTLMPSFAFWSRMVWLKCVFTVIFLIFDAWMASMLSLSREAISGYFFPSISSILAIHASF